MVHQMAVSSFVLLSVAALVMISSMVSASQCTMPSDCQQGECCTLGMQRYSTPTCLPLGQEGDYCRDPNPPTNRSLSYPNGMTLEVVDTYTQMCPCDVYYGLTCYQGICQQSAEHTITNAV